MNVWKRLFPCVFAFASSGLFAATEFKEAEITTVKNQVAHDPGTGASPAKVNEKIRQNSKVTTSAASMAELTFADTSITRLGANSVFSFQSKERLIKLEQGSVLVNTPPGNGGATVDCGGVTGAVSGTTFMASRDASGNVMFVMLEGSGELEVRIEKAGGATSKKIGPGQAAIVGAGALGEDGGFSDTPGGPTDGGKKSGKTQSASSIQVFDVDVKKIVESAPLLKEFPTRLPSMDKIQKTVDGQQTAMKEGRLEKMDVEIAALKEDGDILVGAPRLDPDDMKIVNRKEVPEGGLDIDTAAGGEPQNPQTVVNPFRGDAAAGFNRPSPPVSVADLAAAEGSGSQIPPSSMAMEVKPGEIKVSLDRKVAWNRPVSLSGAPGFPGGGTILRGTDTVTLTADPRLLFPGYAADDTAELRVYDLAAVSETLAAAGSSAGFFPAQEIRKANPARLLPGGPTRAADLAALDAYFYFSQKMPGVTDGPSEFFDPASQLDLADIAIGGKKPVDLRVGQDFVFHAAGTVNAVPGSDMLALTSPADRSAVVVFGDRISLGASSAQWENLAADWVDGFPTSPGSLNYRALSENKPYAYVYNGLPDPGDPVGYFDGSGNPYAEVNFPVWDDEFGNLSGSFKLRHDPAGTAPATLVLAAGEAGFHGVGLELQGGNQRMDLQSAGDLELKTSRIMAVGAGTGTEPTLRVDAKGTVKVGGANADEQVRFEGTEVDTSAGAAPQPGSLAVVRTETALELRNLTIRNFDGSRLERTGVNSGRILMSGSAVRDFKIKELTGMAMNADAKIQMMAVNQTGQLEGDLLVEGSLPVATKLAQEIDTGLTGTDLGKKAVHATEIDLASRQINLNNATLTAMNSITARANTILVQNSFMTVVRGTGMINFYVFDGRVNREWNTVVANQLNFMGSSTFQIGTTSFTIASSGDIANAMNSGQMIETTSPQAGKVNVMKF